MKGAILASTLLLLSASVQIILILVAGLNRDVLMKWYHLKVITEDIQIPSHLDTSQFLKDLTLLTGTDLIGSNQTAQTLNLANSYTINLFSSCAQHSTTTATSSSPNKVDCTPSKFGYEFNFLSLSPSLSFSPEFLNSISYASATRAITITYIFSLLFTFSSIAINITSCITSRLLIFSAISSTLATIFSLASATTSLAIFTSLQRKFTTELNPLGIKTLLGKNLYISSFTTFALLLINTLLLFYTHRRNTQIHQKRRTRGHKSSDDAKLNFAKPQRTKTLQLLKNNIPFLGSSSSRHKYAEIEKQHQQRQMGLGGVRSITVTDHDAHGDREILMRKGFGGGDGRDEEDSDEHDSNGSGNGRGIALRDLPAGGGGMREREMGYEAYRHAA